MKSTTITAAVLAGGLLAASAAAQPALRTHGGPRGFEPDVARMEAHRRQRADELRAILNLRPDQEAAWSAFRAELEPGREGPPEPPPPIDGESGDAARTTPQRIAAMERRITEREAEFRRRAKAILAFYAVLTPQQQRAFDALGRLRHGHGPEAFGRPEPPGPPASS